MADGYSELTLETLQSPDGINQLNSMIRTIYDNIAGDANGVRVFNGYGSPEGVVAAGVGSLYMRVDGGAGTSVYFKESGDGNTGWVANSTSLSLPLSVANGGTGADNSAVVQGVIPYFSATGVISGLGTGTAGQVLETQGAGANPIWATLTSPVGYSLISTTTITASASSTDIAITSTKMYMVKVVLTGDTGTSNITRVRFNGDSTGGNYQYVNRGFDTGASASNSNSASAAQINIGIAQDIGNPYYQYSEFFIYPQVATGVKRLAITGRMMDLTVPVYHDFFGTWTNSADATYFNILRTAGTLTGTVYLYELKTS